MRKSRLSKYKQDRLIEHFVSGSTARTAANLVNVNTKTAAYYFHRLREIIVLETQNDALLSGAPAEHFELFLKECEWRFNNSDPTDQIIQLRQWVKGNMG